MFPRPVLALCLAPLLVAGLPPVFHTATLPSHTAQAQGIREPAASERGLTTEDIEAAEYHGGDLPSGQSAITAKVQILLDRSGISPGVVDGWRGGMSESAIRAFQRRAGLRTDGRMSPEVWQLLQPFAAGPLTMEYTITAEDGYGLVDNIPADYGEKARMSSQGYTSIAESLAERFHMDEKFLISLNSNMAFEPGDSIKVTVPAKPIRGKVTRIIIDKVTRRVAAYDAKGRMVADYPATVGSDQTPSPHGTHTVNAVALDPTYTYNPQRNFKQGENDRVLIIPPGPNGPVGTVWIDLSEPTYGIHGTATPSRLFVSQSSGCVRLTNWDARELAHMVQPGVTVVEFLAPGVSIADVTTGGSWETAATTVARSISATRPPARPQTVALAPAPAHDAAASTSALTAPEPAETERASHDDAPLLPTYDTLSEALATAISAEPSGPYPALQPQAGLNAAPPPRRRAVLPSPAAAATTAATLPASLIVPSPMAAPLPDPAGDPVMTSTLPPLDEQPLQPVMPDPVIPDQVMPRSGS